MDIENILDLFGPVRSSKIKARLLNSGFTEEAARKKISRASHKVKKLDCIQFPNREAFLYLEAQQNSETFISNLLEALNETNAIHYGAVMALAEWGGKVKLEKFKILSGAPQQRKNHKTFDRLLNELKKSKLIDIIKEEEVEFIEINKFIVNSSSIPRNHLHSLEILEEIMTVALENWLKNTGLGSYNSIRRISDFNSYFWSLTVPTYIFPFYQKLPGESPGFVVVDILPQYNIKPDSIKYFIKKFEASKIQWSKKNFLPILLGNHFNSEAFELGKKSGFLITTPNQLFGDEVAELIANIKSSLDNVISLLEDETNLSNMFKSVARLEGKSNNIRGQLFEFVAGFIIHNQSGGEVEIGRKISIGIKKAEIDVFCLEGLKSIRVVECKGYNSNNRVSKDIIEKWSKKIQVVREWIDKTSVYRDREQIYEFWTTSSFEEEALKELTKMRDSVRKYKIEFHDLSGIKTIAREQKLSSIIDILNEHYGSY